MISSRIASLITKLAITQSRCVEVETRIRNIPPATLAMLRTKTNQLGNLARTYLSSYIIGDDTINDDALTILYDKVGAARFNNFASDPNILGNEALLALYQSLRDQIKNLYAIFCSAYANANNFQDGQKLNVLESYVLWAVFLGWMMSRDLVELASSATDAIQTTTQDGGMNRFQEILAEAMAMAGDNGLKKSTQDDEVLCG